MDKHFWNVVAGVTCVLAGMSLLTLGGLIPTIILQRETAEIYAWLALGLLVNPVGLTFAYLGIKAIHYENTPLDHLLEILDSSKPSYGFAALLGGFMTVHQVMHTRVVYLLTDKVDVILAAGLVGLSAMTAHSLYKLGKAR